MSMTREAWQRTPYAETDAKDPDRQMMALLDKYQIRQRQWTEHDGPNNRDACTLAFVAASKTYRITVETMDAKGVERQQLVRQIKRVIFWTLKPLLENALVFSHSKGTWDDGLQKLLLPFLVDNAGHTVFEQIRPHLENVTAKALIDVGRQLALPPPEET